MISSLFLVHVDCIILVRIPLETVLCLHLLLTIDILLGSLYRYGGSLCIYRISAVTLLLRLRASRLPATVTLASKLVCKVVPFNCVTIPIITPSGLVWILISGLCPAPQCMCACAITRMPVAPGPPTGIPPPLAIGGGVAIGNCPGHVPDHTAAGVLVWTRPNLISGS